MWRQVYLFWTKETVKKMEEDINRLAGLEETFDLKIWKRVMEKKKPF